MPARLRAAATFVPTRAGSKLVGTLNLLERNDLGNVALEELHRFVPQVSRGRLGVDDRRPQRRLVLYERGPGIQCVQASLKFARVIGLNIKRIDHRCSPLTPRRRIRSIEDARPGRPSARGRTRHDPHGRRHHRHRGAAYRTTSYSCSSRNGRALVDVALRTVQLGPNAIEAFAEDLTVNVFVGHQGYIVGLALYFVKGLRIGTEGKPTMRFETQSGDGALLLQVVGDRALIQANGEDVVRSVKGADPDDVPL
jgi:hypothetical protein